MRGLIHHEARFSMQLEHFFTENGNWIQFSREQASDFAKQIAGDFNPIHDVDSKRFCVPGDLLFSVLLAKTGFSKHMHVNFSGMISDGVELALVKDDEGHIRVVDRQGKEYLAMEREGEARTDELLATNIAENYVKFSGMNFPHIMVPLMRDAKTMINPDRPLVIYESMALTFDTLDFNVPEVELSDASIDINGKRGAVILAFTFKENGKEIGHGRKRMVMSGLRPYCEEAIADLVNRFNQRKAAYEGINRSK